MHSSPGPISSDGFPHALELTEDRIRDIDGAEDSLESVDFLLARSHYSLKVLKESTNHGLLTFSI